MAQVRSIYTDKRKTANRSRQAYVDGTAVRKLQTAEQYGNRRNTRQAPRMRRAEKKQAEHLSIGYTLVLAVASVLALWVCAGYLQLQADNTSRTKNIAVLEEQLGELKAENADEYNRVTTSVDLEEIREIAINELGMVYAGADQVVLYDNSANDYVKQYAEIPKETSGNLETLLGTISR